MKIKKNLFIFLFLFIFFIFFNKNVLAAGETISFYNFVLGKNYNDVVLPDVSYKYYVIDIDSNNYINFYYSNNEILMSEDGHLHSSGLGRKLVNDNYIYNNQWSSGSVNKGYSYSNYKGGEGQSATILFSNSTIFNDDGSIFLNNYYLFDLRYNENENYYQISNQFSINYSDFDDFTCFITNELGEKIEMEWEFADPFDTTFVFYKDIYANGVYKITIKQKSTGAIYSFNFTCSEILDNFGSLNLHLSTTEKTIEPIFILSNRYYYEGDYDSSDDFLLNYDIEVSYGYDETYGYAPLLQTGFDETVNKNFTEYQFKIVVNGVYKFKILNFETGETTYETFVVRNIGIDNQYGEDVFYDNYDEQGNFNPTPVLFLDYIDTTTVRIRTQPFTFNEIINLKCSTKFEDGEYSLNRNIYSYSLDSGNTIYDDNGENYVKDNVIELSYFYIDVNVDGLYFFQFYNIENKKYTESSIQVDISQFVIDNIDNITKFNDKMIAWSKLHFGFLTYPFELIINIFGRVNNITDSEPILTIPTLKDPFTGTVLIEETSYNFYDAVNLSETTSFLYNTYLIIVDVILIFLFVMLCKKVFEEVFR